MTTASNDLTANRPSAEIIAFPAGGRRAYLMARETADRAKAMEAETAAVSAPMIRGCWYHDDAINEADVVSKSH